MWQKFIIIYTTIFANSFVKSSKINFRENAYEDLVVTIHPDVPDTYGNEIINGIKNLITDGSKKLFIATKGYAYIKSVNILIPTTWNNTRFETEISSEYFFEDGAIRIQNPNPLHGDMPYTLQLGGCGVLGEYIHVTPNYLVNLFGKSDDEIGPHENVFVHEWAKLRYGVFEEYGYPGDKQYPLFYFDDEDELMPNFCTDETLIGRREDISNGGTCSFDPETNLPDENCLFFPSTSSNQNIRSSFMSAPFLKMLDNFCNSSTESHYHHDIYKPNKHNFMCNQKSTWQVIMESPDFIDVIPKNSEFEFNTTFKILRPDDARFTLVLDRSGSMEDHDRKRLQRLKQSSIRWIKYELKLNSQLGITSFSGDVREDKELTKLTAENRETFVNKINDLKSNGGTCLGKGLKQGMDTLNGENDRTSGGTIFFITDGEQSCSNDNEITIHDDGENEVINRAKRSKVRIITVAFGKDADQDLEHLASITGGKTYFVKDGDDGLQDINNVFTDSSTYQPEVPSNDAEILIFQESYSKNEIVDGQFIIDNTLGKDVKFTIDVLGDETVKNLTIYNSNNIVLFNLTNEKISNYYVKEFPILQPDTYSFVIKFTNTIEYTLIGVSSKAGTGQTLPYRTTCWGSASSSDEIDPSKQKLYVSARVEQDNRPVLHAKVEAQIVKENTPQPIVLDLFDNGSGSDLVANDGIYSRYFTRYNGNGRYSLKCQIVGDQNTGFIVQKQGIKIFGNNNTKTYPTKPSISSPICCGSSSGSDLKTQLTGNFTRKAIGISFKVTNSENTNYPPDRVKNLQATIDTNENLIKIDFIATGSDLDDGKADRYELRYSKFEEELTFNETTWVNSNTIESNQLTNESLIPNAGEKISISIDRDIFEWDEKYYMALKAYDPENQSSEISNIAIFKNSDLPKNGGGLSGMTIFGIILFCMSYLTASIMVYSVWTARKSKSKPNETENGLATFKNDVVKEEKISKTHHPIRIESSVRLTVR